MATSPLTEGNESNKDTTRTTTRVAIVLVSMLLVFLFAVSLMVSSLQHLGPAFTNTVLLATSNPFTGLFIGLLITAILQSSSTTTSLVVALVASRAISVTAAVPIIMGANIGTTITSTIVSFAFINRKKEYKRALAAGTYHDFFNILTAMILFPLEWFYGILSKTSSAISGFFFPSSEKSITEPNPSGGSAVDHLVSQILEVFPYPLMLALVSMTIMFLSVLLFRNFMSDLMDAKRPEVFRRFFFENKLKSFLWGAVTTAAIRSSTITTSIVVPIVAKKISSLRKAAPFILGANIGTTITAFIAVVINPATADAINIALIHFLFNAFGVILFLFVPGVRDLPFFLANGLGKLTLKYRFVGLIYLLFTFFLLPFALIFLNR